MTFMDILGKITNLLESHKKDISVGLGIVGVGVTSILTYRAGAKNSKTTKTSKKILNLLPPILSGIGTIAAFIFPNTEKITSNAKKCLHVVSPSLPINRCLDEKEDKLLSSPSKTDDPNMIAKDRVMIFHETFGDGWFHSTLADVLDGEYRSEKAFSEMGSLTLSALYLYLGHSELELNENKEWHYSMTEWIGFKNIKKYTENGEEYIEISASVPPEKPSEHFF